MPVDNSDYLDPDGFTGIGNDEPLAAEVRIEREEDNNRWLLKAIVEHELVTFGITFPGNYRIAGTHTVSIHYKTALNSDYWHKFPPVELNPEHVEQYLAHMGKLGLAAIGIHNGPHNKMLSDDNHPKEDMYG